MKRCSGGTIRPWARHQSYHPLRSWPNKFEDRGRELYEMVQTLQSQKPAVNKPDEKPCSHFDFYCRVENCRQEEHWAFTPCDYDDFGCHVWASLMDSPHEYSRSALQKELECLQKGHYIEFSWQSMLYYIKIQQFQFPIFFAKKYHNKAVVDQLPNHQAGLIEHEELFGFAGFVLTHESLFWESTADVAAAHDEETTSTDIAVHYPSRLYYALSVEH